MVFGIGIDIIEIDRIKAELGKHKGRFSKMVFTEKEIDYCSKNKNLNVQSQCFAGRFAAKEAFFKAIGTGLRNGLGWKDVEIVNDKLGKPGLILKNKSNRVIKKGKIANILLSISHSKHYATAVVILEK
ncbi:MAG: holo-ACP synthase [Candidatus Cloacimonadota bacterium]|nr:holo-ACP synthase [Candidatus Cloacimonadota bacterium]